MFEHHKTLEHAFLRRTPEQQEEERRIALRTMESVLVLVSHWQQALIRNRSGVMRQRAAFFSDLKAMNDGTVMLSPVAQHAMIGLIDRVEEDFRAEKPRPKMAARIGNASQKHASILFDFAAERQGRWDALERPEDFLENMPEECGRFEWLLKTFERNCAKHDASRLHEGLIPFDDNFLKHIGTITAAGIALERCWKRDIRQQEMSVNISSTWRNLADLYIRFHSQLQNISPHRVESIDWDKLEALGIDARVTLGQARGQLQEYFTRKKRVDAGKKGAARKGNLEY